VVLVVVEMGQILLTVMEVLEHRGKDMRVEERGTMRDPIILVQVVEVLVI